MASGPDPGDPGDPVDPADGDEGHPDLPATDVEVATHVHFCAAGSFPLRLAELFFADDGLYIVEYSYITPLFGLGTGQPKRDARTMRAVYDRDGLDGVILSGDRVLWLNYGMIERIVLHSGGRLAHPKLTVRAKDGHSYAYRVHDEERRFEGLAADLDARAREFGYDFEAREGLGLTVRENLIRFLWQ